MTEIPREVWEPRGKKLRCDIKIGRLILNEERVIFIGFIEFGHGCLR